MVRTERCAGMVGAGVLAVCALAGCGGNGSSSADPEPNPATSIAPPSESGSAAEAGDWTMPTGVFRNDEAATGPMELHVEPGRFLLYEDVDGTPDLGYAADCAVDDRSTVTCTGADGFQIVFAWTLTGDTLELTLPGGERNDQEVFEGAQWIRVP